MNKRPCKTCTHHSTSGVKDGKHNDWCCWKGAPAKQARGHCKTMQAYLPKGYERIPEFFKGAQKRNKDA